MHVIGSPGLHSQATSRFALVFHNEFLPSWLGQQQGHLQFEDREVGQEVVRFVVKLLCQIVMKHIEVLGIVAIYARYELLNVLRPGSRRDPGVRGGHYRSCMRDTRSR